MTTYVIDETTIDEQPAAVQRAELPVRDIGPWLGEVYPRVADLLTAVGASPTSLPFARYHRLDEGRFRIEAGFPTTAAAATAAQAQGGPGAGVVAAALAGGRVARTTHIGSYEALIEAYEALAAWLHEHGEEPAGDAWEVYHSGPDEDPTTWRTDVVQPLRPHASP